jgi:hypothetical protein
VPKVAVHQNIEYYKNSDSGSLRHEGPLFFPEHLNDVIFAISPYSENDMIRTLNINDYFYSGEGESPRGTAAISARAQLMMYRNLPKDRLSSTK